MLTTDALIARIADDRYAGLSVEERDANEIALVNEWEKDLAQLHGITHLPQEVQDKVFILAYEHGHASGYSDIESYYISFAEVANLATVLAM